MPDPEPKLTPAQERAVVWLYTKYPKEYRVSRWALSWYMIEQLLFAGILRGEGGNETNFVELTPLGVRIAERILERGKQ